MVRRDSIIKKGRTRRTLDSGTAVLLLLAVSLLASGCAEDILLPPEEGDRWEKVPLPPSGTEIGEAAAFLSDGSVMVGIRTEDGEAAVVKFGEDGSHSLSVVSRNVNMNLTGLFESPSGLIFASGAPGGVFVSKDGGGSWRQVNNHLSNIYVNDIEIDGRGRIFAGTDNGQVFLSTNNGEEWSEVGIEGEYNYINTLCRDSSGAVYAGSSGGEIYRTDNDGLSWTEYNNGMDNSGIIELAAISEDEMLVSTYSGYIFKRASGDSAWRRINSEEDRFHVLHFEKTSFGTILAGSDGFVAYSLDGGETWDDYTGLSTGNNIDPVVDADGFLLAVSRRRGLFRSFDEGENWDLWGWQPRSDGEMMKADSRGNIYVIYNEGIFFSPDQGVSWTYSYDERAIFLSDMVLGPEGNVCCTSSSGKFIVYEGQNISYCIDVFEETGYRWLENLDLDPLGRLYISDYNTGDLLRSDDGGYTWSVIPATLFDEWGQPMEVKSMAFGDSASVFIVTGDEIYRSLDECESWEEMPFKGRAVGVDSSGTVYICSTYGLALSYDNGEHWALKQSQVFGRLMTSDVIFALREDGYIILRFADGSIYTSSDRGDSWVSDPFFSSCDDKVVDIVIAPDGYTYMLGSRHIYRRKTYP